MMTLRKPTKKISALSGVVLLMLLFGAMFAAGVMQPTSAFAEKHFWESLKDLKVTSNPTLNSQCVLSGTVSSEVKWIWIKVTKANKQTDLFLKPTAGSFARKVYLPYGPGNYLIELRVNNLPHMYQDYYQAGEIAVVNQDKRDLTYLLPSVYVQSDDPQIIALAKQITQGRKTDMEKTKAIHDWVASHIAYDTKAYFKGTAGTYSALETLRLKRAVCNGYANLNAALHRAVGIKARIISGVAIQPSKGATWKKTDKTKANHAWNEVLVNEKWIIEDTTWDAGQVNFATQTFKFKLGNKYFNPVPAKFALDHYKLNVEQD